MRKSQIHPAIIQSLFESATNAAGKGQAQWFTPVEWARTLALPLPRYRAVLADLTCGNGALLKNAAHHFTEQLGCEIDSSVLPEASAKQNFVAADLTKFYPLLYAVQWTCDLFVLNPPWDLHWHRERLATLAESQCPAVVAAFAAHDGRTPRATIDSTIATLCIALDRCSDCGEGFLIANEATLQRLIFAKHAPHRALAQHIWAHLVIKGNICQATRSEFNTGVIYFARALQPRCRKVQCDSLAAAKVVCEELRKNRLLHRKGPEARKYLGNEKSAGELWQVAAEEWAFQTFKEVRPPYNIWLDAKAGEIRTHLSLFETYSGRIAKKDADQLFALNGKQPIHLVVQRAQRKALEAAVGLGGRPPGPWSVDPALSAAVHKAVADYNAVRAPLYPLSKIQRLGYLDEQDQIECKKDLKEDLKDAFRQGQHYNIRSTTVAVRRSGTKINVEGELDQVEWNGQELAFFITDESGEERCFMEARLRDPQIKINVLLPDGKPGCDRDLGEECAITFTLQELIEHFHIPEVPDVATLNPADYQRNLKLLDEIVALGGTDFQLKRFQREDYARAALHEGIILGHDTGLGKTIALFLWPLLKTGVQKSGNGSRTSGLRPLAAVLLVVPGDGHDQTDDESKKHFQTQAIRLDRQETFYRLSKLDPRTGRRTLPPNYYLTSYTQLSGNGVVPFPELDSKHPERTLAALNLKEADVLNWFGQRAKVFRVEYGYLDATPDTSWKEIEARWMEKRKGNSEAYIQALDRAYHVLKQITPLDGRRKTLSVDQWRFIRAAFARDQHEEFSAGIGQVRHGIKCLYSPSLADLCQDCFAAIVVDEGTKIKGEETSLSLGVRQITAPHRLVMSATPIKNRFPDVFRLAHFVCGGHAGPTPRFPYGDYDRDAFAEEFLVNERTLKEKEDGKMGRGYVKLTPQVCNIHRAWKLLAPIILRRRKDDCGEEIVPKRRHVVRVPMGLSQAAVYQYHLKAEYRDRKDRKAVGAQLQALRIAAANPASALLVSPDNRPGMVRSPYSFIPKVATVLSLLRQVLERGEQCLVFGAFNDSLDVISARLREAGVKHLLLDGRISQKKRGALARLFKAGPPRGLAAGLSPRQSEYPIMLAGAECMAELHSFHLCNNVILFAYSWAWDKFEQAINRAHRLNSPWPVDVWSVICEGSIDRKLDASLHEKGDATGLVLDGHLLGENPAEVNLAELLHSARVEFDQIKTMDELELEKDWPRLRAALGKAFLAWSRTVSSIHSPAKGLVAPKRSAEADLPLWRQRFFRG